MNIQDMKFGAIDARNEFLSRDRGSRELFQNSFTRPPSFSMEDIKNGNRFLICGPKGSGKTALLRQVHSDLSKKENSASRFVVFRDDIGEQEKTKIVQMSDLSIYSSDDSDSDGEISDAINAWQIFIHREISEILKNRGDLYGVTPGISNYQRVLSSVFADFKNSGFKKFLSSLSKGKVKSGLLGFSVEGEFEFIDSHGAVDTAELARYLNLELMNIWIDNEKKGVRFNLFIDEINIAFVRSANFKRDAILVRDLIAACGKMNSLFSENNLPFYIYTAVRTEVVDAVESSVRELRKLIDDYGVLVEWYQRNVKNADQPIISLILARIDANLINGGYKKIGDTAEKWDNYFDKKIFSASSQGFIQFNTWSRPRDMVRLLSAAAKHVKPGQRFSTTAFSLSQVEYSRGSWEEKRDELNTKYSQSQIESIKKILKECKRRFNYGQLEEAASFLSRVDPRLNQFVKDRNMNLLMEDLFRVGVIGNVYRTNQGKERFGYAYNGWPELNTGQQMCVHRSLWVNLGYVDPTGQMAELFDAEKSQGGRRGTGSRRR